MVWIDGLMALVGLGLAACILVVTVSLSTGLRRTKAKFELYAARDQLYLAASDGLIPVDSKMFKMLRNGIVQVTRYADQLGVPNYVRMRGRASEQEMSRFMDRLMALSPAGRVECARIGVKVNSALLSLMMLNSRFVRIFMSLNRFGDRIEKKIEQSEAPVAMEVKEVRQVKSRIEKLRQVESTNAQAVCM